MNCIFRSCVLASAFFFSSSRATASEFSLNAEKIFPARIPSSPEASEPRRPEPKEWTVMIFVNGKNNLEREALADVNQMELAGSSGGVNIVVELGRMKGQPEGDDATDGDWTGVRRYLITRDTDTTHIASPVLDDRFAADMGSWKELVAFIGWAKVRYPARRYALILWDHGSGWKPFSDSNDPDFANIEKGFSLDDETGHEISALQLGAVLKAAGWTDLFMADGCNMQMASVAYEVRNYAEIMVASEEYEPSEVLRYARLLSMLNENPQAGAEEFGVNAVRVYRDYFLNGGVAENIVLTQSAVRLGGMDLLREKTDAWVKPAMASSSYTDILAAKRGARTFGNDPEYKDLYGFVELVTAATGDAGLKAAGTDLMKFIKTGLVLENWAQHDAIHGISIYVPDSYNPLYGKLAWARDGLWDGFAKYMAAAFGEPHASGPAGKYARPAGLH
jgi:hypothetical protein